MNDNVKFVLNGFRNLSLSEKQEFYEIIKDFEEYPNLTERSIEQSIGVENLSESRSLNKTTRVVFGPSPSGCSCCGR